MLLPGPTAVTLPRVRRDAAAAAEAALRILWPAAKHCGGDAHSADSGGHDHHGTDVIVPSGGCVRAKGPSPHRVVGVSAASDAANSVGAIGPARAARKAGTAVDSPAGALAAAGAAHAIGPRARASRTGGGASESAAGNYVQAISGTSRVIRMFASKVASEGTACGVAQDIASRNNTSATAETTVTPTSAASAGTNLPAASPSISACRASRNINASSSAADSNA
mmetsp:Transcript_34970/g.99861  ORF Transcript_34970/g.99861 Transcript_34970/m.99861 type:complete len:224 (+) Transcript_34970:303-974(+)